MDSKITLNINIMTTEQKQRLLAELDSRIACNMADDLDREMFDNLNAELSALEVDTAYQMCEELTEQGDEEIQREFKGLLSYINN